MKITINHISNKSNKWTSRKMKIEYVTIHNNGNPNSTAKNERTYLDNPSNTSKTAWHIVVDEKDAIEAIPDNIVAYHAGDGTNGNGNTKSIGIEICERGNYNQTILNAIEVTAQKLQEHGLGVDRLRQHYDWSGKDCPKLIRKGYMGWTWDRFKSEVAKKLKPKDKYEILAEKKIITIAKGSFDWKVNCESNAQINGVNVRALINNTYKYCTKKWSFTFTEALNYLVDNKMIGDKLYWEEACKPKGKASGTNVGYLIANIANFVEDK